MKERVISIILTLLLCVSLCASAGAASFIPDEISYQNLNGQQMAVKVYTLLPDQDPMELIEEDFEHGGYHYSYADIVKEEQTFSSEKEHLETGTVETESKDLEDILAELEPTLNYDDGGFQGVLTLDHNSLKTEAAGYQSGSYTVTMTKNYTGLDRNDSSYIDKTAEKDGRTLNLSNVVWSVESTTLVGDELIASSYGAVATYSGTAYYSKATGYLTTAEYKGTVTSTGISGIRYTVTYLGSPIAEEPAEEADPENLRALEPVEEQPSQEQQYIVPIIAGILGLAIIAAALFLGFFKHNVTIYEAVGNRGEYKKCGSMRLNPNAPVIRINQLERAPKGSIAVEISESTARKLFGKTIRVYYRNTTIQHTVGVVSGRYWFMIEATSAQNDPAQSYMEDIE